MRRNIVLLTGPAGSGKTTIANHLCTNFGYVRVRFAGPLKAMMAALGLSYDEIDGPLKEKHCELLGGATPRVAMQKLGVEWGRNLIHPDLWALAWKRRISNEVPYHMPVVADDCRFPNEIAAAKELGIVTVVRLEREGAGLKTSHPSEHQVLPFNCTFENNGSVHEVATIIDALARGRMGAAA